MDPFRRSTGPKKTPDSSRDTDLTAKQRQLLISLVAWYDQEKACWQQYLDVVNKRSTVSLRLLDFLCTNYARVREINIGTLDSGLPEKLHSSYQKQLTSFNKRQFDPFCRRARIRVHINGDRVVTTVGQLNFFRWCLSKGVLKYAVEHCASIDADMKCSEAVEQAVPPQLPQSVVINAVPLSW